MKSFCIIGLGKLGQTLAESLTADGKEVLVIDLDADKIKMPLEVRPVAPGDRFSPLGLHGSKKVTDYLTDIKFEHLHKSSVNVLCDASGKIICIPGLQISNHTRITSSTRQVLTITII